MPRAAAKPAKKATYRDHAKRYGKSVRTVKGWAAIGKEAGDPAPLDDPEAMIDWWTRRMQHRVPDTLWKAAGSEVMMELPKQAAPKTAEKPEVPADEIPLPLEVTGSGLEAEIQRLELLAQQLGQTAAEAGKTKPYLDTLARFGKLTTDLRTEAERHGRLLPKDMLESVIHSFHGPIEREIRLLYQSMCEALGLPPSPEREAAWNAVVDRTFARFQDTLFS